MKKAWIFLLLLFLVFTGCKQKPIVSVDESLQQEIFAESDMVEIVDADNSNTSGEAVGTNTDKLTAGEAPQQLGDWKLLWNDEFEDAQINMDNWSYDIPTNGRWNGEIQSYTENNAFIKDGALIIEARKEPITEADGKIFDFSSGKLITKGKQNWTYGRIEIKAKLPIGQGIWPALWMMPEDEAHYGTWPVCGEIDIMEFLGSKPDEVHGTVHYGDPHKQIQGTYTLKPDQSFVDDYHVYTIEWQPGKIDWYLDDELYHTATNWYSKNSGIGEEFPYPAPFDQNFYLIMNISIGGGWPGNPDETTQFPQQMSVDYVRVYEKDKYEVTVKTEAIELPAREPLDNGNYIYNGSFESSNFEVEVLEGESKVVDEWTFFQGPLGKSICKIEDGIMHVQIENGGEADYSVQVFQTPILLKKDATYQVTFDVKADTERDIKIKVGGDGDRGWEDYAAEPPMQVSTQWETKSFQFTMTQDRDVKSRLEFNMGLSNADVWISNVSLTEIQGGNTNE